MVDLPKKASELEYGLRYNGWDLKADVTCKDNVVKMSLPKKGVVIATVTGRKMTVAFKKRTPKGGFTLVRSEEMAYPKVLKKDYYGVTLDLKPLKKAVEKFSKQLEVQPAVIRKLKRKPPETFEDVPQFILNKGYGFTGLRRAHKIESGYFEGISYIRQDNRVITDPELVGSPEVQEDIWFVLSIQTDTGASVRVLYDGKNSYYLAKWSGYGKGKQLRLINKTVSSVYYGKHFTNSDKQMLDEIIKLGMVTEED
jgi:hypothetical protein